MGWSFGTMLRNSGLGNFDAGDLREYQDAVNRDKCATYCNGACGRTSNGRYGKMVHVGSDYLKLCAKCGSDALFYQRISIKVAENWIAAREEEERQLRYEAYRREQAEHQRLHDESVAKHKEQMKHWRQEKCGENVVWVKQK